MEKNWAKTAIISLILACTFLIVFDTGVVIADAQSSLYKKTQFIHGAYTFLEWVQAAIAFMTLTAYTVLFICFTLLIRNDFE